MTLLRTHVAVLFLLGSFVAMPAQSQQAGSAAMLPNYDPNVMRALAEFRRTGQLSCPHCNLQGVYLIGKTLTHANLAGADLTGANLQRAMLDGAMLAGANLSNARLDGAKLTSPQNGPADLSRANLSGAVMSGVSFGAVDLQFAAVLGTDFTGADLTQAVTGPALKTGLLQGKKTSFHKAHLLRNLQINAASADLSDVVRKPAPAAKTKIKAGTPAWLCGSADLSHLTTEIYVGPKGKPNAPCGSSPANACGTIDLGLQQCTGQSCGVLVEWAEYQRTTTLALKNGVNVYGGCLPPNQASPSLMSILEGPANGVPVVSAIGLSDPTLLTGFQLSASAAVGSNGAPSVGLQVQKSPGLTLKNTEILANNGALGATPEAPPPSEAGGKANGWSPGTVGSCSSTQGGQGSGQSSPTFPTSGCQGFNTCSVSCSGAGCSGTAGAAGSTGNSPNGGSLGSWTCEECPTRWAQNGGSGTPGVDSSCGGAGTPSSNVAGVFNGLIWTGSAGGTGGGGGNASGGGGGGAGGIYTGTCFWVLTRGNGGSGGGGGAGGCGGTGGSGGQAGGASFAVLVSGSTLTLNASRVVGGIGGSGGKGGAAGQGGAGGSGANGATGGPNGTWGGPGTGGRGGNGGAGGGGGGGAGGNGGPAIGIAMSGGASLAGSGTVFYPGAPGAPGNGGSGAESGSGRCTGTTGTTGTPGLVADTHSF